MKKKCYTADGIIDIDDPLKDWDDKKCDWAEFMRTIGMDYSDRVGPSKHESEIVLLVNVDKPSMASSACEYDYYVEVTVGGRSTWEEFWVKGDALVLSRLLSDLGGLTNFISRSETDGALGRI